MSRAILAHHGLMMAQTPSGGDPYFADVSSLLHLDGADGSTTFTDVTGKTWTGNGNAQIDTAQSKFGGASLLLDGSGDYLSSLADADFLLGTGNLTAECWVRPANTTSAYRCIVADFLYPAVGGWALYQNGTNLELWRGGASIRIVPGVLSAAVWKHIAWTRFGNDHRLFIDGVQGGATATDAVNFTNNQIQIGRVVSGSPLYYNGHIDDFRLTKGVARYTSNFTPPSAAFPDS